MKIQKINLCKCVNEERYTTGVIQIDNNWPGVFIQGEQSILYGKMLAELIESIDNDSKPHYTTKAVVRGLSELLQSCNLNISKSIEESNV